MKPVIAISFAQGGSLESGFLSGFGAEAVAGYFPDANAAQKAFAAAIVGGCASVVGGGKFESGAVAGAFTALTYAALSSPQIRQKIWNGAKATAAFAVDVAKKVWNLPNTALGLAVGISGGGFIPFAGATVSFGNNSIQFENHPFFPTGTYTLRDGSVQTAHSGMTLGNAISYSGKATDLTPQYNDPTWGQSTKNWVVIGDHERFHTYQSQRDGIFFLPRYFLNGGISPSNPYEIQADNYAIGFRR